VRCDARKPTCGNCAKSRRDCQGYGIQLSWPRDGDGKRSVVLKTDDMRRGRQHGEDLVSVPLPVRARFVNVRSWDVALALAIQPWNNEASGKYFLQHTGTVLSRMRVGLDGSLYLLTIATLAYYMRSMSTSTSIPRYLPPAVMNEKESNLMGFCTSITSTKPSNVHLLIYRYA
jgi:hypothetical protein